MNDNNLNNQNNMQEPVNQVPVDNVQQNVEQPQPVENLEQVTPQPVENIQPNVVQEPQPQPVPEPQPTEPMPATEPVVPTNNVIDNQPNVTQPLDNQSTIGQQLNPEQPQPETKPKKSKKPLIIVLIIVLVAAVVAFFIIKSTGGSIVSLGSNSNDATIQRQNYFLTVTPPNKFKVYDYTDPERYVSVMDLYINPEIYKGDVLDGDQNIGVMLRIFGDDTSENEEEQLDDLKTDRELTEEQNKKNLSQIKTKKIGKYTYHYYTYEDEYMYWIKGYTVIDKNAFADVDGYIKNKEDHKQSEIENNAFSTIKSFKIDKKSKSDNSIKKYPNYQENTIYANSRKANNIIEYELPKNYKLGDDSILSNKLYEYENSDYSYSVDMKLKYKKDGTGNLCRSYLENDKEENSGSEYTKAEDIKTKTINNRKYQYYTYKESIGWTSNNTIYCTDIDDKTMYIVAYDATSYDDDKPEINIGKEDLKFLNITVKKLPKTKKNKK